MPHIKLLDEDTINKIAAGEVVERPLSVVKELVENSIDASATAITIEIKEGGIKYIRITDNGCGIHPDDIRAAFTNHATSKISNAHDILSVSSLGFRGEALASIASISKCEMITKTEEEIAGTRFILEGGNEVSVEEVASPTGTTIIVRDLFYNTPARRKFLKAASYESAYIIDAVEKIALAHPEISIHLLSSGQTKVKTSGNGKKKDVIYNLYGRDAYRQLIEINSSDDELELSGFISKPSLSRGNRSYEIFEINGRWIHSKLLSKAVEDAYSGYVMQHRFPFAIISLRLPYELLDVNVHPAKLEVRFRKEDEIYEFVKNSIASSLKKNELITEDFETEKIVKQDKEIPIQPYEEARKLAYEYVDAVGESAPSFENVKDAEQLELPKIKILSEPSRPDFKILGILFDTYILVQYKDDFLMIDQHAAHEKVNYERFMSDYNNRAHTSQGVNPPIILTLSDKELNAVRDNMKIFTDIGYEFEFFGGNEMIVRSVPGNIYSDINSNLLIDMIDSISDEYALDKSNVIAEKIAMVSCKAAVKGNQKISMMEAEALIEKLLKLENPYNCPHGRPTTIKISRQEVEKKFKRIL